MHIAKLAVQDPGHRGQTTNLEEKLLEYYLDNLNDSAKEQIEKAHADDRE
jgi:hypothetical protein